MGAKPSSLNELTDRAIEIDNLIHPFPSWSGVLLCQEEGRYPAPCIDYWGLNEITIKNKYPLPLVDAALALLQQAHFFTKLDLQNAYHLVHIHRGDEWKTVFKTQSTTLSIE